MGTVVVTESNYLIDIVFHQLSNTNLYSFIGLVLLLFISAVVSGFEVAFFSLTSEDNRELISNKKINYKKFINLKETSGKLQVNLSIISILSNLGIISLLIYLIDNQYVYSDFSLTTAIFIKFLITLAIIIFVTVLLPKLCAIQYTHKLLILLINPVFHISKIFNPLSNLLLSSVLLIKKEYNNPTRDITIDEYSGAIELTDDEKDNKKILKGLVNYGSTDASEIMKPRVDIVAFGIATSFNELLDKIKKQNYSRIPIFAETLDNIKGVLFVKDLLPHFHKAVFNWQSIIRPAYFVPESKKINDLLLDFQTKKIHMSIVIDEYGGTCGIVTLEDILEEIVGELVDEFDYEGEYYKKIDEYNYVFEGKSLINDFYKIMELDDDFFEEIRGDADTLAGLILEIQGEIPKTGSIIEYKDYIFKIMAADKRRIKQIHITLQNNSKK